MLFTLIRHKTRILRNQFLSWKGKLAGPLFILLYLGCSSIIGAGIAELVTQAKTWFPAVFIPWITCFLLIYGFATVFLSDLIMGHTLNWGQMSTDHRLLVTLPIPYHSLLFLKLYERLLTDITGVMLLAGSFVALTTMSGITPGMVALGLFLFVQVELILGLLVNLASVVIQRILPPSGVANTFSLMGYVSAVIVLLPYIWFSNDLPRALGTLHDLYLNWGSILEWALAPLLLLSNLLVMPFDWILFLKWQGIWAGIILAGMVVYKTFGDWQWLTWVHSGTVRRRQLSLQMLSGVFRKELLLLKSDFNLLTNALLLPFSIIFLEVWVFRDVIMTGKVAPAINALSGALFYFCLFGPLNTIGNEKGAIALLENLPLGSGRWLWEKTRFWCVVALSFFLPVSGWLGYELGFPASHIALLSLWTLVYGVACIWITISFSALFANFQTKVLQQGSTFTGKLAAGLCMGMLISAKAFTLHAAMTWGFFLLLGFCLRRKAVETLEARLDSDRYHHPPFRTADVWLYWLFLAAMTFSLGGIPNHFPDPRMQETITPIVQAIIAVATLLLLSTILVEHRNARSGLTFADFGLRPGTWSSLFHVLAAVLLLFAFAYYTSRLGYSPLSIWISPGISGFLILHLETWVFITTLAIGGLLIPLAEETFFRGMLLQALRDSGWHRICALVTSSALFTFVQPISHMPAAFLTGLLCGWWFQRSGSILPGLFLRSGLTFLLLTHYFM